MMSASNDPMKHDVQVTVDRPKALSTGMNMIWNSIGSLVRLGCNWLMTVLVVRLSSGFDAAGVLSLSMTVYNLVSPLAEFRLRTVQVTDVQNEYSPGEYMGMRTYTTLVAYFIGVVYSFATCNVSAVLPVSLYILGMFVMNYTEIFRAVDQVNLRMDYIGISYTLIGITNLLSFSIILFLSKSITLAIGSILIDNLLIAIFYDWPRARQFVDFRPILNFSRIGKLLIQLLPVVLASMLANAVLSIPRQYLASSAGEAALGVYTSVASPAVIIQAGATYIYSPLIGIFADKFANDKHSALRLLYKTLFAIILIALIFMGLLQIFGPWLLGLLFGNQIQPYLYLLQPALICTLCTALSWYMNDLLISVRDYIGSFIGNLIATITSLCAFHYFIDDYGMNGVSFVGIISCLLSFITLTAFFVRDYNKIVN